MSLGQAAGIPQEKLDALRGDYASSGLFTDEELAILRWADVITDNTAKTDKAAFEAIRAFLSDREILEITVAVAHRNMITRIQDALWTDLEGSDIAPSAMLSGGKGKAKLSGDPAEIWKHHVLHGDA